MTGRKKFQDPAAIEGAIAEVAARADESGVRVALIGGMAMQLLGSDRLTWNLDFVCSGLIEHVQIRNMLSFGGASVSTSRGYPVDLIVRNDAYSALYEEALGSSVVEPGLPVRVVQPRYLATMKMAAARDKDKFDLKILIRLGVVSFEDVAPIVKKHLGEYALRELKRIFDEAAWMASVGET